MLEMRRVLAAVHIPEDLAGMPLEQVVAPVNIADAAGVRGAEIRLTYDTNLLDISQADITAGSVWSGSSMVDVVADVDDAAGTISIFVFQAAAVTASTGSLVDLRFTIRSQAAVGATAVLDLTQVRLNEGAISLNVNPQPGVDPTDGLITIEADGNGGAGDATLSGTVYADVNLNSQPDANEGLPQITISLRNTATGGTRTVTTGNDGRFRFENLPAGSYLLQQQQPAAYIDGGPNEVSIQLAAGQNLTGQNFRELGLKPEFVYNRLSTTLAMPIGSPAWAATLSRIHADAGSVSSGSAADASQAALVAEGEATAPPTSPLEPGAALTDSTAAGMLHAEGESPAESDWWEPNSLTATGTPHGQRLLREEIPGGTSVLPDDCAAAQNRLLPAANVLEAIAAEFERREFSSQRDTTMEWFDRNCDESDNTGRSSALSAENVDFWYRMGNASESENTAWWEALWSDESVSR